MTDLSDLFARVREVHPQGAWTSLEKAQSLAAMIVALRPRLVVEIGVWQGDSLIPQLLALKHVGYGTAVAIDPWSPSASIEGQTDENKKWWGQVNHDHALATFTTRLEALELEGYCRILRARSNDVDPGIELGMISMLHIDGNHAEQAVQDVDRYASRVTLGGILVMDDLGWSGDHVKRAYEHAIAIGFEELYPLGTGCVLQRRSYA